MQRQGPTKSNPKGGSIVFIASIAAYVASKGQTTSDYCASKGAVVSLAKALGVELAIQGVRVNSISPGYAQPSTSVCSFRQTTDKRVQIHDDRHDA